MVKYSLKGQLFLGLIIVKFAYPQKRHGARSAAVMSLPPTTTRDERVQFTLSRHNTCSLREVMYKIYALRESDKSP